MDEIIIDQKKYVSSKRAAEITGYAKDYVGQLCREGRVPARLVGRSWYVLESAIQDHRFGTAQEPAPKIEEPQKEESSPLPSTWESPHYEAVHEDSLPQINRLKVTATQQTTIESSTGEDEHDAVTRMRESWKQWFSSTAEEVIPEAVEIEEVPVAQEEDASVGGDEDEAVPVTIHAIHHPELTREALYTLPAEQIVDDRQPSLETQEASSRRKPRTFRALSALVYFVVFCSLIIGIVGSGYFDNIIISEAQGGFLAGISLYNK